MLYLLYELPYSVKLNQMKLLAFTFGTNRTSLCKRFLSISAGQTVCRGGTQRPCYKIVYFHDPSRRTSYEEAHLACRADGGHLVSIETEAEQRLIEKLIESLLASDGDFWIGLRRKKEEVENGTECQNLYSWSDGSAYKFRYVPVNENGKQAGGGLAPAFSNQKGFFQKNQAVLSQLSSGFLLRTLKSGSSSREQLIPSR